jgi:hypothetical protein
LEKGLVEAQTLKTNSPLQIKLCFFAQLRAVYSIEIVENWTEGLEEDIQVLVSTPCHFRADAEILLEKKITAKRGIPAAAYALILMVNATITICWRIAAYGAIPESQIHLLSVGCTGNNKKKTKDRDY